MRLRVPVVPITINVSAERRPWRADASEPIGRLGDIVAIQKEHGVPVLLVTATTPGEIIHEDRCRVVAETPYRA